MTVFLLFLVVGGLIAGSRSYAFKEYVAGQGWIHHLDSTDKEKLSKHFEYYRQLPQKSRRIFEFRVARFIQLTNFVSKEMTHVTQEMKVLISASAVQIAFGFKDIFLSHFESILIYPDQFFSHSAQRYHKGEVNPRYGVIVLSWKHFVEGYAFNEGVNLGLHEMAHALQLENIITNEEFRFFSDEDIDTWQQLAKHEMNLINDDQSSFFRKYGGTDQSEFFSVAVENFFERPQAFNEYNPQLYHAMSRLLNQNPLFLIKDK